MAAVQQLHRRNTKTATFKFSVLRAPTNPKDKPQVVFVYTVCQNKAQARKDHGIEAARQGTRGTRSKHTREYMHTRIKNGSHANLHKE